MEEARLFLTEGEAKGLAVRSERVDSYDWVKDVYYKNGPEFARIRHIGGVKKIIYGTCAVKELIEDENAEQTLAAEGFKPWFEIRRKDTSLQVCNGDEYFMERIIPLGWSVEIEAKNREDVVAKASRLGFPEERLDWRPLKEIFSERGLC